MIDLSSLPAPDVVETLDYESLLAEYRADLVARHPEIETVIDLESEPAIKILEACAYREMLLRARINDAARACMLAYAKGADLEHLTALLDVVRLEGETDERLRRRAQMALEGETVAGSRGSYVFHALSAAAAVKDAAVDSPAPGVVRIAILSAEGEGAAPENLLAEVDAYLSAEERRPLTDSVVVVSAEIVRYAISATLNIYPGPAAAPVLDAARAAVAAYVADHARLGHDITLSGLYACLHRPGVQRVALSNPAADITIGPQQAAHCTEISISLGAVDV